MGTFVKGFVLGSITALLGVFTAATVSIIHEDRCKLKTSSDNDDGASVENTDMEDGSKEESEGEDDIED